MSSQTKNPPPNLDRNQSFIQNQSPASSSSTTGKIKFGEIAGGTTAECAAICCCCPCGVMNLLILIMYKLPVGICRKALKIRKRRKKKKRKQTQIGLKKCDDSFEEDDFRVHNNNISSSSLSDESEEKSDDSLSSKQLMELEEQMWCKFNGAGFWRSPSQRNM